MNRYLCIHSHFYQPPRENPWLNEIEYQESAYPFHDWNERINNECYRSNASSRILDEEGHVTHLANNYARTSFNFGPTLLSWLEEKDPVTYERILEGDRLSQTLFGGHGSAIAQGYNHIIMPLANRRDKETQIIWGLRDFEKRFGRKAESMWLPETGVDIETLEIMSEHGLKYVILAPRQAKAVKPFGSEEWQDVTGERVDPREPYLVRLPSGRSIAAFFYDGGISKSVAFEGLLHNGEGFANRLLGGFDELREGPQLLHIATDGETYGHHHRRGDMALAYALWHLQKNNLAQITNYGQYLELFPPTKEAQIIENTAWSCEHGVGRWYQDCGCNSGMKGDWNQAWRGPLRHAFDMLRDSVTEPFEKLMKKYTDDPWAMRNDYIEVIDDRSLANTERFLKKWCGDQALTDQQTTEILKAFEAQRNLLLMYTSCAWFFDEVSGVETVQNLQYAYRALELCETIFGIDLLTAFSAELALAPSNIPSLGTGLEAFRRYVMPSRVGSLQKGIHFAIASVFEQFGQTNEVYNSKITLLDFKTYTSGKARLVTGHAKVRSRTTLERQQIIFGVIHMGDHNVSAGVKRFTDLAEYESLRDQAATAFSRADFHETVRVLDRHFGTDIYGIRDLFKDERKRITDLIMSEAMAETEERFGRLYQNNYPLMSYLSSVHEPIPKVFGGIAEFVENRGLRKTLQAEGKIDVDKIRNYLLEARNWGIRIDNEVLALDLSQVLENKMTAFFTDGGSVPQLEEILDLLNIENDFPMGANLGGVQNAFFLWNRGRSANVQEPRFEELVQKLGTQLRVRSSVKNEERNIYV